MKRFCTFVLIAGLASLGAPGCGSDDDDGGGKSGSSGSGGSGGGSGGSSGATGGSAGSSTGGSAGSSSGGSAGSGTAGSAGLSAFYPDGPYGSEVGDTIANWEFEGYVNHTAAQVSTATPYLSAWTLDDLRKSGKKYAVLHIALFA